MTRDSLGAIKKAWITGQIPTGNNNQRNTKK